MRLAFSFVFLAACGGSSSSTTTQPSSSDIATYQALTQRTQDAVGSYRAMMMSSDMTMAGCSSAHDAYDSQVRPWITQMMQMSGVMDGFMDDHQGSGDADMACTSNAMMNELDAHRMAACTFATMSADQSEVMRHASAMASYVGHASVRCTEMMGGLDGSGFSWGPMMMGCTGSSSGMNGGMNGAPH
jgi:hypothetical protein